MNTSIRTIGQDSEESVIEEARRIWLAGGLVAFPTETVYGLGANGWNPDASRKIYQAKGRPSDNPLIWHIGRKEQLAPLLEEDFAKQLDAPFSGEALTMPAKAERLIENFWPGPLTLIFPKAEAVPRVTTGGLDTVAVRMPEHPFAHRLLCETGFPVTAPSANLSGRPSPTTAQHVIEDMDGRIDMIIDGGVVGIGVESTIVDMSGELPMILRPGHITREMLEALIGELAVDPAVAHQADEHVHPKAPGMKYRHYAPKAPMLLVEGEESKVVFWINQKLQEDLQAGRKVGVLATVETEGQYHGAAVLVVGSRQDLDSVEHGLYDVLRSFDRLGVDQIYSESFSREGQGAAVMNRLLKAAGHCVVQAS